MNSNSGHQIMEHITLDAEFIWAGSGDRTVNTFYLFRRKLRAEKPGTYTLSISGYTRYRLYINGEFISNGPPPSPEYISICDVHNVTLPAGFNCISVEVWYFREGASPFLILELKDSGGNVLLSTNETWKALRAPMWRQDTQADINCCPMLHQEFYDARVCPEGWKLTGFDDTLWPKAAVLEPIPLVRRDIPVIGTKPVYANRIELVEEAIGLENRRRSHDLSIVLSMQGKPLEYSTAGKTENLLNESGESIFMSSTNHMNHDFTLDGYYDPCVILDFGKVITGYAEFSLDGFCGGMLDIGYAERLIDGHFVNALEGLHGSDRYIMKGGPEQYRFFAWKAFRYLKLRFHDCFEPVTVHYVRAAAATYPYRKRGNFESSDQLLNKVFDICRYTLRLCSHEHIMDTPWREQGQYCIDVSAVSLGGIYACFGDTALTGKFLWQAAMVQLPSGLIKEATHNWNGAWRGTVFDCSIWWAGALWNHYEYTGDEQWIVRFYPQVSRIVYGVTEYLDKNGLIGPLPYRAFVDWAKIEGLGYGQDHVSGESTFLNALFYGTTAKILKMADLMGDTRMVSYLTDVRAGIKKTYNTQFFDNNKGVYTDLNLKGQKSGVSEHSNMAAILWGLCDSEEAANIINKMFINKSIKFTMAEPFAAAITLQALDKAGCTDIACQIIRDRWGAWMADRGATSLNEEWGHNGSWRSGQYLGFMRSFSHAWGAGPAEFLIKNIMGLEIAEPGCGKIRLNPRNIGEDYTAAYPLPQGDIIVRFRDGSYAVTLPDGVEEV
ncbi:MAG: family 78 glycoside hydrolase catalytic domain [Treponema sp.]|nr:family 78 glycoside hydrolase catalytic domain [Treponema sp.]